MKNPVEEYLRDRLKLVVALANGEASPVSADQILKGLDACVRTHGEWGAEQIHARSVALVATVVGGEPAPPVAQWPADGLAALEADLAAEKIAAESVRRGITPARDPGWRQTVNRSWNQMIDRALKALDTPKPPPLPAQTIESLVDAAVTRQVAERGLVTRDSLPGLATREMHPGQPLPAMHFVGEWREGEDYHPGDVATHDATSWHCGVSTRSRPGDDSTWQLMAQRRDFYKGVFQADTKYRTADAVTSNGSMWFARRDTTSRPGTDDSWVLAVKHGRDARHKPLRAEEAA